jgi:ZIP Zinc transporter
LAGLIAMIAMLIIFFVEFASSRYLARIDEKVMAMQLRESGSQNAMIEPVTTFLTRRKVIINGKRVAISEALAGEAAERAAETLVIESPPTTLNEGSPLLAHPESNGVGKVDSSRLQSHCGHHHYDPPPVDTSESVGLSDVTRKSQLLAVAIMEGGLCFHSIFVGLTLAIATGGGFVSLLTAIMFHRITAVVSS